MSGTGKYWIFFVIVAVGLALSWGQIGRKTHRAFEAEPARYLHVESSCRPRQSPCAALTGDRALVLGPAGRGLLLRQTGFALNSLAQVEARLLEGGQARPVVVRPAPQGWLIAVPESATWPLRVRVSGDGEAAVAEFPLR